MTEDFETWMKQSVAAMNQGDKESWSRKMSADVMVRPVDGWPDPGPFVGIDDAWDFYQGIENNFESSGPHELVEATEFGPKALAAVKRRVRPKGMDEDVDITVYMVFKFEDGLVRENVNFLDRHEALAAASQTV